MVSPFPPPVQGVGLYGRHLVEALAQSPVIEEITVLADRGSAAAHDVRSGKLRVLRVWRRDDWRSAARVVPWITRARPDAVWFNLSLAMFGTQPWAAAVGLAAIPLVRTQGIRTITTLHELPHADQLAPLGVPRPPLAGLSMRMALLTALGSTHVCVTLERYRRLLAQRYGARHVVHIPHGCFAPPRPWTAPRRADSLLMFGTYAPYKNLPLLLDAFQALAMYRPGAHLTIAGVDHPRFPGYLDSVRQRHGELPRVSWQGYVNEAELRDLLARTAVVVAPYAATTGSSSVVYRAAAAGRPIVTSDLLDFRNLAEEQRLRVAFVRANDPRALTATLNSLLGDRADQRRIAEHNLRAVWRVTPEHTMRAYLALLQEQPSEGTAKSPEPAARLPGAQ